LFKDKDVDIILNIHKAVLPQPIVNKMGKIYYLFDLLSIFIDSDEFS